MKQPKAIQINVPKPCHEDWDKMTPCERGRHCAVCKTPVIDYRHYTDEELLKDYFDNPDAKVCGIFNDHQLNRKIFKPKTRKAYYQWFINLALITLLHNTQTATAKTNEPAKTVLVTPEYTPQHAHGSLSGKIIDSDSNVVKNAVVVLYDNEDSTIVKGDGISGFDGNFLIKPLEQGNYDVKITYGNGYKPTLIKNVTIRQDKTTVVDDVMLQKPTSENDTGMVIIELYHLPMIDASTITSEEVEKMGTRNITSIVTAAPGVYSEEKKKSNFIKRLWHKIFK